MTWASVLAILKGAADWIAQNPIGALILGLLSGIGVLGAQKKLADLRAARAERDAATARTEASAGQIEAQRKEVETNLRRNKAEAGQAAKDGQAAEGRQEQAHEDVDQLLDKWNQRKP